MQIVTVPFLNDLTNIVFSYHSDLKSMGAKSNDADTELPGIVNREDRM